MARGVTDEQNYTDIADAIRAKMAGFETIASFNGRTGAVVPQSGDYTAAMVGAAPIWQSGTAYAAGAYCIHNGYLWVNTSGGASTGVEPGTNYNVWNVRYSNENLLDNAYFVNADAIVDQRNGYVVPPGTKVYSDQELTKLFSMIETYHNVDYRGTDYAYYSVNTNTVYFSPNDCVRGYTGTGYTIDRWRQDGNGTPTCTLTNEGILLQSGTANSAFRQRLQSLAAGEYTLSFLTDEYGLFSSALTWDGSTQAGVNIAENVNLYLQINGNLPAATLAITKESVSLTLLAAKLEHGPISTLANDLPPNYATELAKCQRYQFVMNLSNGNSFGNGYAFSATDARIVVPLPVTMRGTPTVTISNPDAIRILHSSGSMAVTGFNSTPIAGSAQDGIANILLTTSGLTTWEPIACRTNGNCKLIFDANL